MGEEVRKGREKEPSDGENGRSAEEKSTLWREACSGEEKDTAARKRGKVRGKEDMSAREQRALDENKEPKNGENGQNGAGNGENP